MFNLKTIYKNVAEDPKAKDMFWGNKTPIESNNSENIVDLD